MPFTDATLNFLAELTLNNDRTWFQANKGRYEGEVLAPLREFVVTASEGCAEAGLPLIGDPVRSIYRIYRDVRFSKDKSPYKTFASALLTRDGVKHGDGVLYLHVDPTGCFLAVGFYQPRKELLDGFRKTIVAEPEVWNGVVEGIPSLSRTDILSRVPRGYEGYKGGPLADSLCLKSFITMEPLEDEELISPELVARAIAFAQRCKPLLEWGWRVSDSLGLLPED